MKRLTKRFFSLLLFLTGYLAPCLAQNANEIWMENWMTLQQLLYTKATAPWSLTAADLKRIAELQGTTPFAVCVNDKTATCKPVNSPLPVSGLKLKGERLNAEKVRLHWETIAEYNSKVFVVERQSFYVANQYDSVGMVLAAGTSNTKSNYEDVDLNNYQGASFYRIRQVDNDGKFTYSNIIQINGIAEGFSVNVVPNPAKAGLLRFYFTTSSSGETIDFTVSNAAGMQLIKKQNFNVNNGYYEVESKQLAPGYYFITVYTQDSIYTKSFVIIY